MMKLGIDLACLGLGFRQALLQTVRLGVRGVQVTAAGELTPSRLTQTGRREVRHLIRSHDLECLAVVCPLRHGLDEAQGQMERMDHVRQCLALSLDLGARTVITQPGPIPSEEENSPRRLDEVLLDLGRHGDRTGTILALETGLASGPTLADYLARFDTGGLGVCYDAANLLLNGFDPYESGRALGSKIVVCQAKDARRAGVSRAAAEVPVGHGDIDWLQIAGVMEEIGYRGWLSVKRDGGDNRLGDVAAGVQFLRRIVGNDER